MVVMYDAQAKGEDVKPLPVIDLTGKKAAKSFNVGTTEAVAKLLAEMFEEEWMAQRKKAMADKVTVRRHLASPCRAHRRHSCRWPRNHCYHVPAFRPSSPLSLLGGGGGGGGWRCRWLSSPKWEISGSRSGRDGWRITLRRGR